MLNICLLIGGCDAVEGNSIMLKDSARISLTQRCWQSLPYMVLLERCVPQMAQERLKCPLPRTNENDAWRAYKTHQRRSLAELCVGLLYSALLMSSSSFEL